MELKCLKIKRLSISRSHITICKYDNFPPVFHSYYFLSYFSIGWTPFAANSCLTLSKYVGSGYPKYAEPP